MKIIMMSDYRTCIGGIEQYIQDAAQLLTSQNYETTVVGLSLSNRLLNHIRPFLLPITAYNLRFATHTLWIIITQKPSLIRWHSVSRYIGRLPLWVAGLFHIRTRMMYHDLGYFHPYPSLVTDVSQIPASRSLRSRLAAGRIVGQTSITQTILMTLKFLSVSAIRSALLRSVSVHLVPSPYMVSIVQQRGVPADKIQVLGHFGRIE